MGVREGAPRPDISTPETFRRALLAAKFIGFISRPAFKGGSAEAGLAYRE